MVRLNFMKRVFFALGCDIFPVKHIQVHKSATQLRFYKSTAAKYKKIHTKHSCADFL